jgi:hypothetical protein
VAGDVVLAAGDITSCSKPAPVRYTADILGSRIARHSGPVTVAPLGDLVYPAGSAALYAECYDLYWGQYKDRTKPVIGNHDYGFGGRGYGYIDSNGEHFDAHFFDSMFYREPEPKSGQMPPPPRDREGYFYAYTLGESWLILVLDSNCSKFDGQVRGCAAKSPQAQWLREKLTRNTLPCVAAMSHHPRFSHGMHGDNDNGSKRASGGTFDLDPLWNILTAHDVDLLMSGHDHHYERYSKLDEFGKPSHDGTRQFVVGTGGRSIRKVKRSWNSSTHRVINEFGVLELRLLLDGYEWEFFGGGDESNDWTVAPLDSGWERCNGRRD